MTQTANTMQMDRWQDEVAFSHEMSSAVLKEHLERLAVAGDCLLCEWFGRFKRGDK